MLHLHFKVRACSQTVSKRSEFLYAAAAAPSEHSPFRAISLNIPSCTVEVVRSCELSPRRPSPQTSRTAMDCQCETGYQSGIYWDASQATAKRIGTSHSEQSES